jgi:putative ABC transport system permease protein
MQTLLQDLRYGLRMLRTSPGFTAVAIVALALGIGANTAIFSVVNAALIRPLPYQDSDRLVVIWEHNRPRNRPRNVISPANFLDWRDQSTLCSQMAAFIDIRLNLTGLDAPEELPAQVATVNLFSLLGASAALGRTFAPNEGIDGQNNVVILSHGLWQRRFGGDPQVIGRTVKLNNNDLTIIGVMPAGFRLFIKHLSLTGKAAEAWVPAAWGDSARVRSGRAWQALARLKPGVSFEQAQAEMNTIASRLEEQYPDFNKGWGVNVVPLREQFTGEISTALLVLMGAVGFVLLIACANVANLLLARAATRQKEIAIRTALGAGRGRVIRQLLTESLILASLGGACGLLLAVWGADALLALSPPHLLPLDSVRLDLRVLSFTFGVSLATGVLFGLIPALAASRLNLNDTLKEGGRETASGAHHARARHLFVVAEMALSLVLLIGAGLMIRSVLRLQAVNPGFDAESMLTVRLLLPGAKYREDHQRTAFFKQLLERVRALPGVQAASAVDASPFGTLGSATSFIIAGRPTPAAGQMPTTDVRVVDPEFFRVLGIALKAGRTFTEREATEVTHVVVINETMARQYFADQNPIGQRITIRMTDEPVPSEIIGVVGDAKYVGLDVEPRAMAYWPHPELARNAMTLVVRAERNPLSLAPAVKREVQSMDKDQPISDVQTIEQMLANSMARARFTTLLLGLFAAVAMMLAAVGIYGVMSYAVTQRTHEIGIRLALGARSSDVMRLVVGQGMKLAAAGVVIGLGASLGLTRLLAGLLFGVSATDPVTFGVITVLLVGVALVACYVPARRAMKVDPMVALRYE